MHLFRSFLTRRFLCFAAVGGTGVVIHLTILALVYEVAKGPFLVGQLLAVVTAMSTNFLLNNELTYRNQRLRGSALLPGWLSFCSLSLVGAAVNSGVTMALYAVGVAWWLAPLVGVAAGFAWNFRSTAAVTWSAKAHSASDLA